MMYMMYQTIIALPFVTRTSCFRPMGSCWIGLKDDAIEGNFVWVDGSTLGSWNTWDGGSPSNAGICSIAEMHNSEQSFLGRFCQNKPAMCLFFTG